MSLVWSGLLGELAGTDVPTGEGAVLLTVWWRLRRPSSLTARRRAARCRRQRGGGHRRSRKSACGVGHPSAMSQCCVCMEANAEKSVVGALFSRPFQRLRPTAVSVGDPMKMTLPIHRTLVRRATRRRLDARLNESLLPRRKDLPHLAVPRSAPPSKDRIARASDGDVGRKDRGVGVPFVETLDHRFVSFFLSSF